MPIRGPAPRNELFEELLYRLEIVTLVVVPPPMVAIGVIPAIASVVLRPALELAVISARRIPTLNCTASVPTPKSRPTAKSASPWVSLSLPVAADVREKDPMPPPRPDKPKLDEFEPDVLSSP